MGDQREQAIFGIWRRVNEIATTTENTAEIRNILHEAGIKTAVHVGVPPEDFTPVMVAEWVLGQWADMIDHDSPFLNSGRNVSLHQWEVVTGEPWVYPRDKESAE